MNPSNAHSTQNRAYNTSQSIQSPPLVMTQMDENNYTEALNDLRRTASLPFSTSRDNTDFSELLRYWLRAFFGNKMHITTKV